MLKTKTFDCVGMKNRIQTEINKESEGLSEAEISERRRILLETSDDPVAKKWRQLEKVDTVTPKGTKP